MTRYLEPSFSTMAPPGKEYRDSWDRIFGKKNEGAVTVTAIEGDTGTTETITDPYEARVHYYGPPLMPLARALADAVDDELRYTNFPDPRLKPIIEALRAWRAAVPRGA